MLKLNFCRKPHRIYISPIIVMVVACAVFMLRGLYPFGDLSISYYDMSQSFVPIYTHTWDVLHGLKSPYLSWNVGMVGSMTDTVGSFVYFPSNLFFLFVKRENILNSLSVFFIIRIMIAALCMELYIGSHISSKVYQMLAGVSYSLSGFVLQYYTNSTFLDLVMIFPLLVYFLERLIFKSKYIGYVIVLSLILITNIQLAFMVGLYLLLKSFLITKSMDIEGSKKVIVRLGIVSACAMLIASFVIVPEIVQLTHSARLENGHNRGIISLLVAGKCGFQEQKNFMLYGSEIGLAMLGIAILNGRGFVKKYNSSIIMMILLSLPIAFENIHLLWHVGSYEHFPMRFGYMLSFEMITFAFSVLCNDRKSFKLGKYLRLLGVAMIPFLIIILSKMMMQFRQYGIRDLLAYNGYGILLISLCIYYLCISFEYNEKVIQVLCGIMIIAQGAIGLYNMVAPIDTLSLECSEKYIDKSEEFYDDSKKTDNPFDKIKDVNLAMNANYGFIIDRPVIGGWINGIDSSVQDQLSRMGYSKNYTRLLDNGGTVFTDAILGIKHIYAENDVDTYLYKKTDNTNEYDCRYTIANVLINDEIPYDIMGFEYQNELFKSVTGCNEQLIDYKRLNDFFDGGLIDTDVNCTVELDIEEPTTLYIYSDQDCEYNYRISINGVTKGMPVLIDFDNTYYKTPYLNGMVECGSYENEKVKLTVESDTDLPGLQIGLLKLDVLARGISEIKTEYSNMVVNSNRLSADLVSDREGTWLLPIGFSNNWKVLVDGQQIMPKAILNGAFLGVQTSNPGKHTVEIRYVPQGLILGILLSIFGVAFVLFLVSNSRAMDVICVISGRLGVFIYNWIIVFVIISVYIVPIISAILFRIIYYYMS